MKRWAAGTEQDQGRKKPMSYACPHLEAMHASCSIAKHLFDGHIHLSGWCRDDGLVMSSHRLSTVRLLAAVRP